MNEIRAIIVDDEYLNRELISMLVTKFKPEVHISAIVGNIRDAHKVILEQKPQLVFLDIKMPDGNGFELLHKLGPRDFQVIFVTGFDQYEKEALRAQAFDYVIKPIDLEKFKETLDRVCTRITSGNSI
jgi:two-component system, LytTR family, response regulator